MTIRKIITAHSRLFVTAAYKISPFSAAFRIFCVPVTWLKRARPISYCYGRRRRSGVTEKDTSIAECVGVKREIGERRTAGAMEIFSESRKSFKMDRKSPMASSIKSSISRKLLQFLGNYTDDVLAVTHAHTHTHTLSLSLSWSLAHTIQLIR